MIRTILTLAVALAVTLIGTWAAGAESVGPVSFPISMTQHGSYILATGGSNHQPLPAGTTFGPGGVPMPPGAMSSRAGSGTILASRPNRASLRRAPTDYQGAPAADALGPGGTPLPALAKSNPNVHVDTVPLTAAECTVLKADAASRGITLPANPCFLLRYSYSTNHQPLAPGEASVIPSSQEAPPFQPGGSTAPASGASSGYWAWNDWAAEVDSLTGGHLWSLTLSMSGVANGTNVYQWYTGCTPAGTGYQASISWCGYLYNGGGWPYYGMQFGLDGQICSVQIGPISAGCASHGVRQWINDYGNPTTEYSW